MFVQAAFAEAFSTALGRFLALDPDHARLLRPLAGKVIAVELRPYGPRFVLSPTRDTILILPDDPGPADVILRGSPLAFVRLVLSGHPRSRLFEGGIEMEGDVDVARRLQVLLQRLDLDWEGWLSGVAGERFAAGLTGLVREVSVWQRHAWRTFQWNLAEFLQEETRVLPAPLEAEDLYRRIARLRDDVERLEARLERLQQKIKA